jgi:hypothetical protein
MKFEIKSWMLKGSVTCIFHGLFTDAHNKLDDQEIEVRSLAEAKDSCSSFCTKTSPETNRLLSSEHRRFFPGGKTR